MNPKVSIIIPCFNDAAFIEQSVKSALDQTYVNKEVIVVDDGSNQKTKAVLKSLEPKINLLITQENKGTSAARNTGIEAATGKYILVLDSDDYFEVTFCDKAIRILKDNPEVKLATCYAHWFQDDYNFQIFKPRGGGLTNFLTSSSSLSNSLFLKKDWSAVGGYDEKMFKGWEDWEFFIRLHKNGGETYVIPEVLFNYRKKNNSRTTMANEHKFELLEYIYLKHADLYKENFDLFIKHLLNEFKKEEGEKIKNRNRIEFRLGKAFLRPLRFIKSLIS
jgi:glycosyltransferase involved in cell wall biosynthesis